MIKPEDFLSQLSAAGIEFFCGVPDSLLKEFLAYLQDTLGADNHQITASEGAAIALAAGYHLGSGKIALVYLQNSGLGNAVNPLLSLTHDKVYGLPILLLVGHRGEPGVKDEPQHQAMGEATLAMLDNLGVPYFLLKENEADSAALVAAAVDKARALSSPVAIVVSAGTFAKAPVVVAHKNKVNFSFEGSVNRDEVIALLLAAIEKLADKPAVVASTGFNGRVLYDARIKADSPTDADFLNVGAMGHSLPLALGIALGHGDRGVVCIEGDGSLLMHLGSLLSAGKSGARVRHLLLNNAAHESVGAQPTGAQALHFDEIARLAGYRFASRLSEDNIEQVLPGAIEQFLKAPTPAFLEVPVALGTRNDLPRPSSDFKGSRDKFKTFLRDKK